MSAVSLKGEQRCATRLTSQKTTPSLGTRRPVQNGLQPEIVNMAEDIKDSKLWICSRLEYERDSSKVYVPLLD